MTLIIESISKPTDKSFSNTAGIKKFVYFALLAEVDTTTFPTLPASPADLAAAGTITDPITFKTGGRFYQFENSAEKPKLISEIVGETDSKGWENKGMMTIPGNTPEMIGFLDQHINADFIIIYEDLQGNHRLLGTPDLPANISTGNMDSGDSVSSAKATTLELRAPGRIAPVYTGAISMTPAV